MAVGDFAKGIIRATGDVVEGLTKNDKAIRNSIKSANKKAIKVGKEAMDAAKLKNPSLNARELRKVQRNAMIDAGFRSTKQTAGHKVGNFLGGGIRDTYKNMNGTGPSGKKMNFGAAIKDAHKGADGKLSTTKMAGTFIGASAVGRVATGGGITKDKNGNTNLIGIPFI